MIFYRIRCITCVCRTNTFMGILSSLSNRIMDRLWRKFCRIVLRNPGADIFQCRLSNTNRVCTHVSNKTHTAWTKVYAFIKLLRNLHRLSGSKTQTIRSSLLQCWRCKRRLWLYSFISFLDSRNDTLRRFYFFDDFINFSFILKFRLCTFIQYKLSCKFCPAFWKISIKSPVFHWNKIFNFFFSLTDYAQSYRLNASCRKSILYFFP